MKVYNVLKHLGVTTASHLKFSQRCIDAEDNVKKMLGFINTNFSYKNKDIILLLHTSIRLVRPHLENAVQCWSLHHAKDITILEAVQRRTTMIPSLRSKSCDDRLSQLNLFFHEKCRLRGKLVECFKILY